MPISGEWMNMCPSTHLEYYLATKGRSSDTHYHVDRSQRPDMLSEKQTQKDTQGVIPLMGNVRNWQTHRHKGGLPGCLRRAGGGSDEDRVLGGMEGSGMNRVVVVKYCLLHRRPLNHSL